jgi:hypothetical protein
VVKMENKESPGTIETQGPRMLPMVTLSNGKTYFIDERLNQLRNIKNPHDYIDDYLDELDREDFDKVRRCEHLFTKFITVHCGTCEKVLFSGTEKQARHLIIYCTDCTSDSLTDSRM